MLCYFNAMELRISDLLPDYFEQVRKENSEVWGKDLSFATGEMIKIVAPSGSGKTSLIHFLYGLRKQYSGTVLLNGNNLKKTGEEKLATLRQNTMSVVFQDMRLFPEQTVFENINIKRQLDPFHTEDAISVMAERLGIASRLNVKAGICSYGEQQRMVIIRALMQPFNFLLLDEPFSHLDNQNSQLAMELMLEEAARRNAGIIFADLERIDYFPWTRLYHL